MPDPETAGSSEGNALPPVAKTLPVEELRPADHVLPRELLEKYALVYDFEVRCGPPGAAAGPGAAASSSTAGAPGPAQSQHVASASLAVPSLPTISGLQVVVKKSSGTKSKGPTELILEKKDGGGPANASANAGSASPQLPSEAGTRWQLVDVCPFLQKEHPGEGVTLADGSQHVYREWRVDFFQMACFSRNVATESFLDKFIDFSEAPRLLMEPTALTHVPSRAPL